MSLLALGGMVLALFTVMVDEQEVVSSVETTSKLQDQVVKQKRYRLTDVYVQENFVQDSSLSIDLERREFFGSGLAFKEGVLYGAGLGELTLEDYYQGEVNAFLEATAYLPFDKSSIKKEGYRQIIDLKQQWASLNALDTTSTILVQYQAGSLKKLRINYDKDFRPEKIEGYYDNQKDQGWKPIYLIDYPYQDQESFETARDAYIEAIQERETAEASQG